MGFNMFAKQRDAREVDRDPGVQEMMELARRTRMKARLPEAKDIARAFKRLFDAKKESERPIQDTEAQLALQSLRFCSLARTEKKAEAEDHLTEEELVNAAHVVQSSVHISTQAHEELSQALFEEAASSACSSDGIERCLLAYIAILTNLGSTEKARSLLLNRETSKPETAGSDATFNPSAWLKILQGFTKEENAVEVQETLNLLQKRNLPELHRHDLIRQMLTYHTTLKDVRGLKQWWSSYRQEVLSGKSNADGIDDTSLGQDVKAVLFWCANNEELQFGHEVVREVMKDTPNKLVWDAVFVWAASTGKSVDEINRMIDVMEKSNKSSRNPQSLRMADSTTINALIEYAISKHDPYTAERYIALGRDRNIEPDATTYVLQMEYRLKVGDVDGALIAYMNLQHKDTSSNEDVPTVNQLIVALCNTKKHDYNTIMNVAADLSDRRARFEPATAGALALLHLQRGEKDDAIDLLNTHAFHYSSADRGSLRDKIIAYITDGSTPKWRAWEAYTVIRDAFEEMPREPRTKIMEYFFDRARADMGTNIFLDMRRHTREANMPTSETYVAAFMGISRSADRESLDVIHNQLKLDFNIDTTTELLNSLMIAYISCGNARYAIHIWKQIVASKTGPSYNSLHIALRACERTDFGDEVAKHLWALLGRRGVDYDNSLWTSYICALAGNGDIDFAINTLETAFEAKKLEVDSYLLASMYEAAPGSAKQEEVTNWAAAKFPGLWAEVVKMGFYEADEWAVSKSVKGLNRVLNP